MKQKKQPVSLLPWAWALSGLPVNLAVDLHPAHNYISILSTSASGVCSHL